MHITICKNSILKKKPIKHTLILVILFFLPVIFLLFLYPAKHHFNPLDVVHQAVNELPGRSAIQLNNHLTVLGFLGQHPERMVLETSNLKELIYNKFKGFKKFQVLFIAPFGAEDSAKRLKQELTKYSELKYWNTVFLDDNEIRTLYGSLKTTKPLQNNLASTEVFIIDKTLNQRGRNDDRTKTEVEKNKAPYPLLSYSCNEVAVLKNKMADDLRILFQEVRERRKGNLDSSSRRANDLKQGNEKN